MFIIRAPVATYNGISAGVSFTAGVGETDNPGALAYFARAGYEIEPFHPETVAETVPDAYAGLTKKQLVALATARGAEIDPRATNAVLRDALIAAAAADEVATATTSTDAEPVTPMTTQPNPFAPGEGA